MIIVSKRINHKIAPASYNQILIRKKIKNTFSVNQRQVEDHYVMMSN